MARKITMNANSNKTVAEVFGEFVISQTAQGLSPVTLTNYNHYFHSISRHLDITQRMEALTKSKLEAMVVSMRQSGLAHNSISSYCRVLRTFLGWCQREGMTVPGFALLLSGGIAYTIGAILYGVGAKKHWMHAIFHIFVVIGSLLQFLAIYLYVI